MPTLKLLSITTKLLHYFPSELSHSLALNGLKLLHNLGVLKFLLNNQIKASQSTAKININIPKFKNLKNQLGIAAGLDKNGDYIDCLAALGVGFIEVGTVTPATQKGNTKPRLFRDKTNYALLNRMGFNNKGVNHLVSRLKLRKSTIPIGVSIGKNYFTQIDEAYKDYLFCLNKVYEHADYVAINISSPNTKDLRNLSSRQYFDHLLSALKKMQLEKSKEHGYIPLFVKISPDEEIKAIESICSSIKDSKIDGIICTNTSTNHERKYGEGGISGKPLFLPSTNIQKQVRSIMGTDFPIIASGGVMSVSDYQNKINSGANLVQIYSGFIYEGPKLISEILNS